MLRETKRLKEIAAMLRDTQKSFDAAVVRSGRRFGRTWGAPPICCA